MKKILLLLFIPLSFTAYTCLNISGTNMNGETTELDGVDFLIAPNDYPHQERIDSELADLRASLASGDYDGSIDEVHCDIGGYMIYNGEYQAAIDYLNANVTEKQDNYSFCSNIGVAYELVGNLDSALYWTNRGIEINEDSHNGSEWIHVRILEIEKAMQTDKAWLDKNDIFDFSLSLDSVPSVFPEEFDFNEFFEQLRYQLHERTFFVKAENQDPLVARLILILADVYARAFDTKECIATYDMAARYDTALQPIVDKRKAYLAQFDLENGLESYEYTDHTGHNIAHDGDREENMATQPNEPPVTDTKKSGKKIPVNDMLLYLGGGLVLICLFIFLFFRYSSKKRKA